MCAAPLAPLEHLTWRQDAATAKARTPLTSKSSAALDDPVEEVETLLFAV